MDDGMQWLAGTILSAVISSVITVGFLSALVTRLQIRIDHQNNGIKRVYAPGEHSRTLKKQLAEARAIQLLALSGYGFTHAYRRIPDRLRGQGRDSGIPAGAARNRLYERCG